MYTILGKYRQTCAIYDIFEEPIFDKKILKRRPECALVWLCWLCADCVPYRLYCRTAQVAGNPAPQISKLSPIPKCFARPKKQQIFVFFFYPVCHFVWHFPFKISYKISQYCLDIWYIYCRYMILAKWCEIQYLSDNITQPWSGAARSALGVSKKNL